MKWKAIAFDLDGTLVNTLDDLAVSTNKALQVNGLPIFPLDSYRQMVGNGARKLIERALCEQATPALTEKVLADFIHIYDADCLQLTRPYEGVMEAVEQLHQQGIPLLVITNKPEAQAKKIVSYFFGDTLFSAVYGGLAGRKSKPDPTVTLSELKHLGVSPENALFVGDSDVDIVTAHAAGMTGAGAVWGFRGESELISAGADYLLYKPADIFVI